MTKNRKPFKTCTFAAVNIFKTSNQVDMNKKNSIQFTGRAGLLFTDENGMTYSVNSEMLASKQYDMVIFTKDIEPKDSNHKLEDKDKEMIISKIFELTKGIKWSVE